MLLRRVTGKSMLPTLKPGQLVMVWGWFYKPKVNDIVVFKHDGMEKIKRIAKIKDNQVWLIGDNLSSSTDSRQFGALPIKSIVGKVYYL